jgi:glucuronate isomerase
MTTLRLVADRLLPADPGVRALARQLYGHIRALPIISPHGHVDAEVLLRDEAFADPASLLISPDHYVFRLLHAAGVSLDELGVGRQAGTQPGALSEPEARVAWRRLCRHWAVFRGTPVRHWLEAELVDIFGVTERPDADNADRLYDQVASCLEDPRFRPRALFDRFHIEVLATTDDPCDDLAAHAALSADPTWSARVIPTFRPDRYLDPLSLGWAARLSDLERASGIDTGTYGGYLMSLQDRRRYFVAHGAVSADHSHPDVETEALDAREAQRIFADARLGRASAAESTAFRRHMLAEMARMSCEDGLVMTLHPGICRDHHRPTAARFGSDSGHDIPITVEYTRALRPLLERFGTNPNLHLVLFTVDESTYSREIAPLAGF